MSYSLRFNEVAARTMGPQGAVAHLDGRAAEPGESPPWQLPDSLRALWRMVSNGHRGAGACPAAEERHVSCADIDELGDSRVAMTCCWTNPACL